MELPDRRPAAVDASGHALRVRSGRELCQECDEQSEADQDGNRRARHRRRPQHRVQVAVRLVVRRQLLVRRRLLVMAVTMTRVLLRVRQVVQTRKCPGARGAEYDEKQDGSEMAHRGRIVLQTRTEVKCTALPSRQNGSTQASPNGTGRRPTICR